MKYQIDLIEQNDGIVEYKIRLGARVVGGGWAIGDDRAIVEAKLQIGNGETIDQIEKAA